MKNTIVLLLVAVMACGFTGCTTPPEQVARNVLAGASGAVANAQTKYATQCQANPKGSVCETINRTVDGQNAAITALETYCGFELTGNLPAPSATCVPVKSALPALQTAVANLNQLVTELKSAAGVSEKEEPVFPDPDVPAPARADLTGGAVALALVALKALLDSIGKGQIKDVGDDTIDAIQGAIGEFEQVNGSPVTFEQLEGLRLHKLWPDPAPDATGGATQTSGGPVANTAAAPEQGQEAQKTS